MNLLRRTLLNSPSVRGTCAIVAIILATSPPCWAARFPIEPPELQPTYLAKRIFLLPYQVNPNDPLASEVEQVRLLMSRNSTNQWVTLQEAEANLRGFSYHCPADGQYWFAVQMVDRRGNAWPSGEIKPQIRLIVDTEKPQLKLAFTHDGRQAMLRYSARDANLKADSLRIELQMDNGTWRPLQLPAADVTQDDRLMGRARFESESESLKVRAVVADKAGNQVFANAAAQAEEASAFRFNNPEPMRAPSPADYEPDRRGDITDPFQGSGPSLGEAQTGDRISQSRGNRAPDLEWPALNQPRDHKPLPTVRVPANERSRFDTEGAPPFQNAYTGSPNEQVNPFMEARTAKTQAGGERDGAPALLVNDRFNRSAVDPQDVPRDELTPAPYRHQMEANPIVEDGGWLSPAELSNLPAMLVSSRTFDVEYDLETVGRWGVSRVEIWGTRDGGQTWNNYAVDDDNRSPIRVTVPGSGTFGLKILVDGANGAAAPIPRAGDSPEMTVRVDLHAPTAELVSAEIGRGPLADNLLIQWAAADTNLERRPIGLFYSSNPDGPWSTVATGLENSGQYAWRIERHVPDRFYLKVEVRDTAGNVTAAQTPSPVVLNRPQPAGRLRGVRSISNPGNPRSFEPVPTVRPQPSRNRRLRDETAMEGVQGARQ